MSSTPALSYKAELYANQNCKGEPLGTIELSDPSANYLLVPSQTVPAAVKLTMTDIFGESIKPVVVSVQSSAVRPAVEIDSESVAGIDYQLYHQDSRRRENYFNPPLQAPDESHYWLNLDELAKGKLVRQGIARGFDLSIREGRSHGYAIVFDGLLNVAIDDAYLFYAQIDGAYRIELDGEELLSWDGQHGTTQRAAHALLAHGLHPIKVTYLYDDLPADNFILEWESTTQPRQPITLQSLSTPKRSSQPTSSIDAISLGHGNAEIRVTVQANGQKLNRTQLYLGDLQLLEGQGHELKYHGPLAAGANRLWARTLFNEIETIDTPVVTLEVPQQTWSSAWKLRNVSDKNAKAGFWQTTDGSFQFFGDGMHTITQRMTGDFQLTCRVDQFNGSNGEPVNPEAWVGLTAREFGDRLNWQWGRDFQLVQTVRSGIRTSPDFTDFGGTRLSSYMLQARRPWLRIARKGDLWFAWTSENAKDWELGAYQFKKMQPELDIGLFVSALPQNAQAHFSARISQVTIEQGQDAVVESLLPKPVPSAMTDGDRITGVVCSYQDPRIVVIRSNRYGMMRSIDGGEHWTAIHGQFADKPLAVRSVAIDPKDSNHMLCGIGLVHTKVYGPLPMQAHPGIV